MLTSLTGGTVVTSLAPPAVVRADVTIEDGRVTSIRRGSPPEARRVDCTDMVVMPGLVCAHHHLYSTLARGMPFTLEAPTTFLEILRRVWWRLDRALDARGVFCSARAGAVEALLAGTTTVVDHHSSPNAIEGSLGRIAAAFAGAGARGILCYEVSDRDGPAGVRRALEETRRAASIPERWAGDLPWAHSGWPHIRVMMGAHASFTLNDETLAACVEGAHSLGLGIHIHVAEDGCDQRDSMARFGKRVVRRLLDAGVLGPSALLAHCIHLDEEEIGAVNASGATAVHNPRSNMNNRVGHANVARFDRLALGTDGIGGDMFAEARAGFWRAREADGTVAPQWALDRLAESARFAGRIFAEPLLGTVQLGAPADLIVLDYQPPTPLTAETLGAHLVFGISARAVRDVFVAGRRVVRDHRPWTWPRSDSEIRTEARRLWQAMEDIPEHPFVPAGAR
jgi:putative selenium metabolism protein SsnA